MKKNRFIHEWDSNFLMKTLRIMRITVFLLLASILQTFANDVYSQKTRLSLDFLGTKLGDVLDEIENKTEFNFLYCLSTTSKLVCNVFICCRQGCYSLLH
jgi:hypothetical protein